MLSSLLRLNERYDENQPEVNKDESTRYWKIIK